MKNKKLIQPMGVGNIHRYCIENNLNLEDVEKYISPDFEYKRCEAGGAYSRSNFYIIDGNFYTNWHEDVKLK